MNMKIGKSGPLSGCVTVPGDKSISHRSIMLGSIAEGTTRIRGFLCGADCISTMNCFRAMGAQIRQDGTDVTVQGAGLHGLTAPHDVLDCGNSGTTTRILSGLLAGQSFDSVLTGDASIRKRPMKRVIEPLSLMGGRISSETGNGCAPLHIRGSRLHGISFHSPVPSAQVKSAVLLAGLYAEGETSVTEDVLSRNHTELMLSGFGADIEAEGTTALLRPGRKLHACDITIPGDISSAAYFLGAGLIVPGSELLIRNVGVNPTRSGLLTVLENMGADLSVLNLHTEAGESVADLSVKYSPLHGTEVSGEIIPRLIDELPLIAVLAAAAEGQTVIKDAAELKVKESDRIALMSEGLSAMGADITATEDGWIINGGKMLSGAAVNTAKDHRIAMSLAVAGLIAGGETLIRDADCVNISYPEFFDTLFSCSCPA